MSADTHSRESKTKMSPDVSRAGLPIEEVPPESRRASVSPAAERRGAVLHIDEADAFFGKWASVRDAHERYANLEVSGLLQRLEEDPGIGIVAASRGADVPPAWMKTFTFVLASDRKQRQPAGLLWRVVSGMAKRFSPKMAVIRPMARQN